MALAHTDPEVASEGGEVDDDYASEWINLNVFTARLMQKGLIRFSVLAVLEIRNALEEELPTAGLVRDYKLSVASQWILISGTLIFKDAFKGDVLDETELRATAPGQLYINSGGKHGLCMDRWRFWQKRLGEVGSTGVGEKVGLMAKQAARHMEDIMEQDGRAIARRLGTGNEAYGSKSGIDPSGT